MRRLVAAMVLTMWATTTWATTEEPLPQEGPLLARLARVARLYRDNALSFTCDENIHYAGRGAPVIHKFRYIYRYSKERSRLEDFRVLRGRESKLSDEKKKRIELENYGLPAYLQRAYSWVFIFEEENQPHYRYEIEAREEALGRPAIRVSFEPIPPVEDAINDWHGRAWVDEETSQVLRVEAVPAQEFVQVELLRKALDKTEAAQNVLGYRGTFTFSDVTTEFDVEKNGMRFPGRSLIKRTEHIVNARGEGSARRERPLYQVSQTYKRYQFFSVRTADQVRAFVLEE